MVSKNPQIPNTMSALHKPLLESTTERFWQKVKKTKTCWKWLGNYAGKDYGAFWTGQKQVRAHIFSYELAHGPIPPGLVLDHICRVHKCVNPSHLEAITNRENILRGISPPAIQSRQTHCKRGHEFSKMNTRLERGKYGREKRQCRLCDRIRKRWVSLPIANQLIRALEGYVLAMSSGNPDLLEHADKKARAAILAAKERNFARVVSGPS